MTIEDFIIWVACFAFGCLFTWTLIDSSWRTDCKKLGAHISDGTVYICSPKDAK